MKKCRNCGRVKYDYEFPTCFFCGSSNYCNTCIIRHNGRCLNCGNSIIPLTEPPIPVTPPRPAPRPIAPSVTPRCLMISNASKSAAAFSCLILLAIILCIIGFNDLRYSMISWSFVLGQIGAIHSAAHFSALDYLAHPYTFTISTLPSNSVVPIVVTLLVGLCIGIFIKCGDLAANIALIIGVMLQAYYFTHWAFLPSQTLIILWFSAIVKHGFTMNEIILSIQVYIASFPLAEYSPLDFFLTIGILWIAGLVSGLTSSYLQYREFLTIWSVPRNLFVILSILWSFLIIYCWRNILLLVFFLGILFFLIWCAFHIEHYE